MLLVVVATTQRRAFDAAGVVPFIGVLTQLILAVLLFLAPQLRGRDTATRDRLLARTGQLVVARGVTLNAGGVAVVVGIGLDVVTDLSAGPLVRVGWVAITVGIGAHLVPALWPLGTARQPAGS